MFKFAICLKAITLVKALNPWVRYAFCNVYTLTFPFSVGTLVLRTPGELGANLVYLEIE